MCDRRIGLHATQGVKEWAEAESRTNGNCRPVPESGTGRNGGEARRGCEVRVRGNCGSEVRVRGDCGSKVRVKDARLKNKSRRPLQRQRQRAGGTPALRKAKAGASELLRLQISNYAKNWPMRRNFS